jgi:hypothetical protein
VTAPQRRVAAPHRLPDRWPRAVLSALVLIASLAVACAAPTVSPSRSPTTSPMPSLTPVPGSPSTSAEPAPSVSQTNTDTAVGRIWDSLPPSFPRISGATPIETGAGPTSGTFAVGGTVDDAVATIRAGLTGLGYNVDVGSPLEDGSVVLDAGGGEDPECRIEVRFTPLSGTITMAVLYGSACPFS